MVNKHYLIAEAGINHNGNLKTALKLIDAAKKSGANAIKFQTYKTEKRVPKKYKKIFDILKKCELSYKEFQILKNYCDEKKITFFSTPFDLEAVEFLTELKVKLFKVASFDIANKPLIEGILKKNKKTIISTGMANLKEISSVYKKFKIKKIPLILLHCISSYPNKIETSYLSNIKYLKEKYNCEIGLSDHTNGIEVPLYSSLLGVKIIEKHFKIDENHKCVDAKVSITSKQFAELKKNLEIVEKMIGRPKFGIRLEEKNTKIFKRKKIY